MSEGRLRRKLAIGLEQVDRANGVDLEVQERNGRRSIVARLGGSVDHRLKALTFEELEHPLPVPDIDGYVPKARTRALQSRGVPGGIAGGPEEDGPHVVIIPHDFVATLVEVLHSLGAKISQLEPVTRIFMERLARDCGG